MRTPSILIIDDEPNNFDVVETFLSAGAGEAAPWETVTPDEVRVYQLYYASSGKEAIEGLESFSPDLILLDVMMPEMDGIEVCQTIKAIPKWQAVPIVMVTALNSKLSLSQCLAAGATDFISKPLNRLELRARVQAMLRIKRQYDDLQALLNLREDMVNAIVHDLRNPLSNILAGLELLSSPNYPEERRNSKLSQVYTSAQSLQALIGDLLRIALFESGKILLHRTKVNLHELIQSSISDFEERASRKKQSLIAQFPPSSQLVCVDVSMFRRTLDNLLSNAIKFSPHNSSTVVNVEYPTPNDFKIQVIDSGSGISEDLQQKIFEKYEIGALMPNVSQIGLGLAFCKMVVEAHGGTICAKSNQPQGAIFEITITA
ncbi:hybrid sensor histidine kinase/response regulator [Pseudanabaena sp. PCC 6802]|uniref:hybrid sensor histidine kinase/response regulator n=1 Tax=Pseudanabaena sp. PCC 6802 TaxID=118173 RepID=UPI00034A4B87|nr:hybrid sensor histidine kinase/response regulator [Pseudanabaena sp. PCC 6802]